MTPSRGGPGDSSTGLAGELGRYAGFGLTIGLATALFAWIGTLIDGWLRTEPLFVVLGAFLGFAAAFYSMYWRLVLQPARERREAEEERASGDGGPG